ncbi:MAG: diguanylate cyclase [Heliobacteriaceae bacterium]|nr:diguanylate cyclase [Heliobacteriaceae bacterium]
MPKVLIVGTPEITGGNTAEILAGAGYVVQAVPDAAACLQLLERDVPDVILMDRLLPGLTGTELTRIIKQRTEFRDISVVLVTADDQRMDRLACLFGVVEALPKSATAAGLINCLEEVMRQKLAVDRFIKREKSGTLELTWDFLTGLANRYQFQARLGEEIARANRYGAYFSLIMADVDLFRQFNDTYGFECGDAVLVEIADMMRLLTRGADIVSRYGGTEFGIIAPETNLSGGLAMAEKLRVALADREIRFSYRGELKSTQVTLSFGVSQFREFDTWEQLLARAQEAIYLAKQNGRNRVEYIS